MILNVRKNQLHIADNEPIVRRFVE